MNKTDDRVLHIKNQDYFNTVEKFAEDNGILDRFKKAMEYLRTFGAGSEEDYRTELFPDSYGGNKVNFIANMLRKDKYGEWRNWYTIGCIYFESDRDWSMHS